MTGGLKGAVTGVIALIVLYDVLAGAKLDSTGHPTGPVVSLFGWPAAAVRWFVDPTVPGLPDRGTATAQATSTTAENAAASTPPPPPTVQDKLARVSNV